MRSREIEKIMREWMLKNWGERCKDYEPDCGLCNAWRAFDFLFHPDKHGMVKLGNRRISNVMVIR